MRVELDLSGAIDVAAERARLSKDLAAAQKERDVNAAKLRNDAFTGKAPEPVWPRCATGSPPPRPTSPASAPPSTRCPADEP